MFCDFKSEKPSESFGTISFSCKVNSRVPKKKKKGFQAKYELPPQPIAIVWRTTLAISTCACDWTPVAVWCRPTIGSGPSSSLSIRRPASGDPPTTTGSAPTSIVRRTGLGWGGKDNACGDCFASSKETRDAALRREASRWRARAADGYFPGEDQ